MKVRALLSGWFAVLLLVAIAVSSAAQNPADSASVIAASNPPVATAAPAPLFRSEVPIEFTLVANYKALHRSKTKASKVHPAVLMYRDEGGEHEVPLRVRSRGHWRLKNCDMPPLLLNFQKETAQGTAFQGIDKGRLVMHCKNNDEFDQYVLREYQLYRVWNTLTDMSHRARLARVTYVDSATKQPLTTRYAFILENDEDMAERNAGKILKAQGAKVGDLDPYHDALVGVFQYMVGNVDWSVAGLHNVLLIRKDDPPQVYATVYDFDFTGTVKTRYSRPDYRLPIRTVRQRLYRGYCAPPEDFARVFTLFNERKPAIYALYQDDIGKLLTEDYVRETLAYYDEFYKVVNDRRLARDRIIGECLEAQ